MTDINPLNEVRKVRISLDREGLNAKQYVVATIFAKNQLGDRDQVASIEVDSEVVIHINGEQHIALSVALDDRDRAANLPPKPTEKAKK